MDNPEIVQEMGSFIDFEDKFNMRLAFKSHKDDNSLPEIVVCDYVPACCMITNKWSFKKSQEVLIQIILYTGMNVDFWCTRVKRAGYERHAIQ